MDFRVKPGNDNGDAAPPRPSLSVARAGPGTRLPRGTARAARAAPYPAFRPAILAIDKNVAALARIAEQHAIIEKGRIVWRASTAVLLADPALGQRSLGVRRPSPIEKISAHKKLSGRLSGLRGCC